ncbi:hypothetical protein L1987_20708 [Smallanthus sonchifolius]|uniref:Uncharacterized protein n=1 Tax=Smallanthus sonchifolius TaxID=185202 RepID=A0ACB9ISU0_9ASTR|nr:hypothetical protein L1987_20708 [Smallanthus sonchifolius]
MDGAPVRAVAEWLPAMKEMSLSCSESGIHWPSISSSLNGRSSEASGLKRATIKPLLSTKNDERRASGEGEDTEKRFRGIRRGAVNRSVGLGLASSSKTRPEIKEVKDIEDLTRSLCKMSTINSFLKLDGSVGFSVRSIYAFAYLGKGY